MKKLFKRSVAVVLAAMMTMSVAACGKGNSASNSGSAGSTAKPASNAGSASVSQSVEAKEKDYSEPYVYSYASIQITESTDYNSPDDAMTQYWEQKYNFKWDINSISSDKWDQTVNTWVYAEDLPDVTIYDYKHPQMMDWVDQGLLFEFPDGW